METSVWVCLVRPWFSRRVMLHLAIMRRITRWAAMMFVLGASSVPTPDLFPGAAEGTVTKAPLFLESVLLHTKLRRLFMFETTCLLIELVYIRFARLILMVEPTVTMWGPLWTWNGLPAYVMLPTMRLPWQLTQLHRWCELRVSDVMAALGTIPPSEPLTMLSLKSGRILLATVLARRLRRPRFARVVSMVPGTLFMLTRSAVLLGTSLVTQLLTSSLTLEGAVEGILISGLLILMVVVMCERRTMVLLQENGTVAPIRVTMAPVYLMVEMVRLVDMLNE